jgi:glycine betaine catabolism A
MNISRLSREYYTSETIYSREIAQIFSRQWLCVGRSSDISQPGQYFLCQLAEDNVIITRGSDGVARAHHNLCRHRGMRLCAEPVGQFRKTIQCPYHAWTYDLDGRLRGAPHMEEVADFNKADWPLLPAHLVEWEGFLFLNLAEEPEPFAAVYAPLLDKFRQWQLSDLQTVRRITYNVAANWKLIFQNYSECYHCPGVHPKLADLSPYRSGENDLTEGLVLGGPSHIAEGHHSLTMSGRLCGLPLSSPENARLVYYYTFLPNMFLSLHPDYVLVHVLQPEGNGRTQITCHWLFHPASIAQPDFNPDDAIELWDMTNRQDWEMCELTQQGVNSRVFTPGPYATLETMPVAFEQSYFNLMRD